MEGSPMKTSIATTALSFALVTSALAQGPAARTNPKAGPAPPATGDAKVFKSSEEIPKPEIVPPTPGVALATGSVDEYLLQKEHGPFMVMAQTFRGPDASRYAVALSRELRESYHLPAYIFYMK